MEIEKKGYISHSEFLGINLNGDLQYKIDDIMAKCQMKDDMDLINYVTNILNEPRKDLIIELYKELGKDFIVFKLEQTLKIQNEGGIKKNNSDENIDTRKSLGGIFFTLMKKNEGNRDIIKKIFRINYRKRNERKRTYRLLEKMNITD